jgi:hypothetical protein
MTFIFLVNGIKNTYIDILSFIDQEVDDLFKSFFGIFLQIRLPNAHYLPTQYAQFMFIPFITLDISQNLIFPKSSQFAMRLFYPPAVPEIAIHENTELLFRNSDIGATGSAFIMLLKIYAFPIQIFENYFLRGRILSSDVRHKPTSFLWRKYIRHNDSSQRLCQS